MKRFLLSLVLAGLVISQAKGEIILKDIRVLESPFGPVRKNLILGPGDQLFFTFNAKGVKTTEKGQVNATLTVQVQDKDGKYLVNTSTKLDVFLAFGKDVLQCHAHVAMGLNVPEGDYRVQLTLNDNVGKESATMEKKIECKKLGFRIVRPLFSYDKEGKIFAPPGGVVGQPLFVHFGLVEADKSQKKIKLQMEMETIDSKGNSMMAKPIQAKAEISNPEQVAKVEVVNFNGVFVLNQVGEFRLRVTVRDEMGKKTARYEVPLKVTGF